MLAKVVQTAAHDGRLTGERILGLLGIGGRRMVAALIWSFVVRR